MVKFNFKDFSWKGFAFGFFGVFVIALVLTDFGLLISLGGTDPAPSARYIHEVETALAWLWPITVFIVACFAGVLAATT